MKKTIRWVLYTYYDWIRNGRYIDANIIKREIETSYSGRFGLDDDDPILNYLTILKK